MPLSLTANGRHGARSPGASTCSATLARRLLPACLLAAGLLAAGALHAQSPTVRTADPTPYCGNDGVWIQLLGGGGPELDDGEAGASYLVFLDNQARLLVDTAPGSSYHFDLSGGRMADLDVILLTSLKADRTTDLPAFVVGGRYAERDRLLPVLGPDGRGSYPDTDTFVQRLIGPDGVYPDLAGYLDTPGSHGFRLSPRNVPAAGSRRWADFGNERLLLSAIPVHHGEVPALAWRVEIGGMKIVFTGDFGRPIRQMAEFADGADALVIHHSVPEGARGDFADRHVTPSQIGQIAAQAGVRMVIMGHRMNRTRGRESLSMAAVREHYQGPLLFADSLECWGL